MARAFPLVLCIAGWLLPGCVVALGEEPLFGEVSRQCEMATPVGIDSQPAPFALQFENETAFLFGETWLAEADESGRRQRDNTFARVADVDAACAGELEYARDDHGVALQVIALNAEELAHNQSSDDRIVLWPVGAFVFEERAIVYYDKQLLRGGDYFDGVRIGTGVCVMEPGQACVRAEPNLFVDEPTLLWRWPTPSFGNGAFLANDEHAYLYSCEKHGDFDHRCRTARVDPTQVGDPSAYEYLRFGGEWSERVEDSTTDIRDQTSMSTGWNEFTQSYISMASRLLDEDIELRRAAEPFAGWDAPVTLFDAITPSSWFVGDVRVHSGLSTHERDLVISYHSNTEGGSGNHLAVFRLSDRLRGEPR